MLVGGVISVLVGGVLHIRLTHYRPLQRSVVYIVLKFFKVKITRIYRTSVLVSSGLDFAFSKIHRKVPRSTSQTINRSSFQYEAISTLKAWPAYCYSCSIRCYSSHCCWLSMHSSLELVFSSPSTSIINILIALRLFDDDDDAEGGGDNGCGSSGKVWFLFQFPSHVQQQTIWTWRACPVCILPNNT